jgi:transcriptional regulator with XRE-family HTH domain
MEPSCPLAASDLWPRLLGVAIQIRRRHLGLSIERAAELAGLETFMWAALEQGEWVPEDEATIRALADTLEESNVPLSLLALLCRESREPGSPS